MNSSRRLFPSQLDDEQICLVVREHWFRLAERLVVWLIFAVLLILFRTFGPSFAPALFEGQAGTAAALLMEIYTMVLALSVFLLWLLYYLNIQIVTNLRIVDVDQQGLFAHTVAELHIDKIEDVTSENTGLFGTMFNFGNVYVQTAGTIERFVFENIPNPAGMEKLILDLYEKSSPEASGKKPGARLSNQN